VAKVISGFKCRHTGKIYHVGDEYDGEHLKEMQEKGYVEETEYTSKPIETKFTKPKKHKG